MSNNNHKKNNSTNSSMTVNSEMVFNNLMGAFSRQSFLSRQMDGPNRDIDRECGYNLNSFTPGMYSTLYRYEGLAQRVVNVFPDECWAVYPELFELEDSTLTPFELGWNKLLKNPNTHPWQYLHRLDRLSGIASFGIMLLGFNDLSENYTLDMPVKGLDDFGNRINNEVPSEKKLIYMRVFSQDLVNILEYDTNTYSPRYGMPTIYGVSMVSPGQFMDGVSPPIIQNRIHWTRIIHCADNKKSSEVFGFSRMEPVLKRIQDSRKVLGGAAEMFWQGAFPGFAFEVFEKLTDTATIQVDSLKKDMQAYRDGLQRFLTAVGGQWKSLAPQVADPSNVMREIYANVAMTIGVPLRILLGSESGHLASSQDSGNLNKKAAKRQRDHIDPSLIYTYTDRLILVNALPAPTSGEYQTEWTDLNSLSENDQATVALKKTQALLQYVTSGAFRLVPPRQYLANVLGFSILQINGIIKAAGGEDSIIGYLQELVTQGNGNNDPAFSDSSPESKTGDQGKRNSLG